ncbi:trimeric intracellular cation channel family protein [Lutibacter holmesii]|uniref:Trimeric intracellular cation channel family protein n=1 Tax=Lutibacter holmesii TaxID=1137985 RepID=A0ABW3WRP3_9FLAO
MNFFDVLDLLGTIAFATSGALTAINKKFDPFGVFIVAFVTALGGGTLRDVLIGRAPVGWMLETYYVYTILATVVITIIFRKQIKFLTKSMFLFDTIGLGIFTIIGTQLGVESHFNPIISIALGTMTAAFGGVIRDILCNQIPVIFRKEIYATAAIIGSITFLILNMFKLDININYAITTSIVIIIRLIAVRFHLSLPTFYTKN